jgi:hypothetical protein
MDRRSIFGLLRTSVSVACLGACVLLLALWVRSYQVEDRVSGYHAQIGGFRLYSSQGWLVCSRNNAPAAQQNYSWGIELGSEEFWLAPNDDRLRFQLSRQFIQLAGFASASIPHWLPALASGILGVFFAASRRLRFSLRTLLIATTLMAVVFGLAVSLR